MASKRNKRKAEKAKWVFEIRSAKGTQEIEVLNAHKYETGETIEYDEVVKKGWATAQNKDDLKQTLSWCFNGDPDKFVILWGLQANKYTYGKAYVCE